MASSFYWYDLETSGTEPKWDRIVQFAGMRTNAQLEPVGDELSMYVELPDDVLPNPAATLVTGITPQMAKERGIREIDALTRINGLFAEPGTCVVGYNSLRFDDEFMRYGLYRNLLEPYAREWQHGNSRWDLIDLVRAAGALRREGIVWPRDDEGLPVYKLEELTQANGIDHGNAHDALSDVRATVGLARLLRDKQPKLFSYYLDLRQKKNVRRLLEPYGARLCVHVSGMYPRARFGTAPIMSLTRHPTNSNSIVVVDLMEDCEPLLQCPAEELRARLFTAGAEDRPPLKEIRINRCPFVATIDVLNEENTERLGIDLKLVKERARRLSQPGLAEKIMRVYAQERPAPNADPDAALYEGFLQDEDRSRCHYFHKELEAGRWLALDFKDARLPVLIERLKARGFPDRLSDEERQRWQAFVRDKLGGEGDWLTLAKFQAELDSMGERTLTERERGLVAALREHAADLRQRYLL